MKDCRKFYIDGTWVQPTEPRDFPVVKPAHAERTRTIPLGSRADVQTALPVATRPVLSNPEPAVRLLHWVAGLLTGKSVG